MMSSASSQMADRDGANDPVRWSVVTGAAGSLGSAVAMRLASQGGNVLALDANEAVSALFSDADNVTAVAVDLTDPAALQSCLKSAIGASDGVAMLVNAAGLIWNEPLVALRGARFVSHALETWNRVIDANLTTAFVASSVIGARMIRAGGGSILNVSSISAQGIAGQAAYGAAKAGVEGLTRALAQELGPLGVRVNCVSPGFIDVPSTRTALSPDVLAGYLGRTPLRKLGDVEAFLDLVVAICENGFMNGAVVDFDGGLRI